MERKLNFNLFLGNELICEYHDVSKFRKSSLTNHLQLINQHNNSIGFLSIDLLKNNLEVTHKQIIEEYNTICISYNIQLKDIKK